MSSPEAVPSGLGRDSRRWLALAVVMTGIVIVAIDTTIVVLALPEIQRRLHVGLASVIWVVIGYLLVVTILSTQVGKLGDMFGRVRMYEAGFVVFVLGSALCALAWNEAAIVSFRVLQGVGGALISANSGAVVADTFPAEERGKAFGFTTIGWNLGAVAGIVLGGLIVTYTSWRWIFWINVPIGVVALIVALKVLVERGNPERRSIDYVGIVLLGAGLFGVLWAMTTLASEPFDSTVLGYGLGGIVCLAAFVLVEHLQPEPMLDLALFKVPTMSSSLLASAFQGLGSFAVLFLVIMYLQGARGLSPLHASLLLVPGYLVGGAIAPLAGRLTDRIGPVAPATAGLAVQAVSLALYAQLTISSGLWAVFAISVINGVGSGFFWPANTSAVMKAAPARVFGIASGMLRTFGNIGMVFSFSVAILVASRTISRHVAFAIFVGTKTLQHSAGAAFTTGIHAAFYASMGFLAIAAVLSASRHRGFRKAMAEIPPTQT